MTRFLPATRKLAEVRIPLLQGAYSSFPCMPRFLSDQNSWWWHYNPHPDDNVSTFWMKGQSLEKFHSPRTVVATGCWFHTDLLRWRGHSQRSSRSSLVFNKKIVVPLAFVAVRCTLVHWQGPGDQESKPGASKQTSCNIIMPISFCFTKWLISFCLQNTEMDAR